MFFVVSQILILLVIVFLLYLLSWFLPTDSPWSPWWSTSSKVARRLCLLVKLGEEDVFYELGSGTGTACVIAAKEFGAKVVGIESSKSRVLWSNMKAKRIGAGANVKFLQSSFFKVDLSPATVVYFYLVPRVIKKIKPKLLKDLKPGTKIVSYVYEIDYLPLVKMDDKSQLYLYRIPKNKRKKGLSF